MGAKRIKGITIEIDGSTTGLDKALKGVNGNISKVQSSLKDVNRLLKIDPRNTELLEQKQRLLSKAVDETKTKLDALKKASEQAAKTAGNYDAWKSAFTPIQEEMGKTQDRVKKLKEKMAELEKSGKVDTQEYRALGEELQKEESHLKDLKQQAKEVNEEFGKPISPEQFDNLQREIIETEQNLQDLERQARESASVLGTQMQETGKKIQQVGDGITSAGKKLMPASTAVAGLGALSIKTAADFESSMSQVAATMGMTSKEIENGSKDYEKLETAARDMGAATQYSASEAAEALNYLALAGYDADRAVETLPTVLNLAAAGGIDLASASDMVTDAMSALGDTAGTAENFVDKMAKTSQKSNTNVAQLGEAILTVGGTAKTLAGGTTELNTALGILADNGVKGAEGGTALRNIIMSLSAPTDTAAQKMKELGLQVFDANGNMRPMNDIFNDLNTILSTMTQGEQTQVLNEIFNKTDLKSVNAMLANSGERFTELSGYLENCGGTAAAMADTMNSNLNGQLVQLKSAVSEAAISIGETLMPMIKDLVAKIQEWTDKFNSLDDKQKQIIVTIGLVAAAVGPVLVILGTLISSIGTIVSAVGILIPFLSGVSAPLMIIAGVIAAVVAAGVLLYKNWDTIREKCAEIWDAVKEKVSGVVEGIKSAVTEKLEAVKETVSSAFNSVKETVSAVWETIKNIVQVSVMFLVEVISAAFQLITLPFRFIWENCKETIIEIWDGIKGKITETLDMIKGVVGTAWDAVKTKVTEVLEGLKEVIQFVWDGIKSKVTAAVEVVKTVVTDVWNTIKSTADTVWNAIKSAIEIPINAAKAFVTEAIEAIKNKVKSVFEGVKSTVTTVWDSIKSAIETPINAAKDAVKSAIDKIKSFFDFSWSLPKLKLPHFEISGKFSLDPPSVPHFGIEWYKKGGIMGSPTAFGVNGSNVMAGGEAGPEAILPLEPFYTRLTQILDSKIANIEQRITLEPFYTRLAQILDSKITNVEQRIVLELPVYVNGNYSKTEIAEIAAKGISRAQKYNAKGIKVKVRK